MVDKLRFVGMTMEKLQLKELVDIYLGVTHTPKYVYAGVPFLSVKDISGGQINFDNCKYISEEEYNSLSQGAKPQVGDMLFCRVGTIGKPIIIPKGTPRFGSFVSLGYLRNKDNSRCRMDYLKHWMNSKSFYDQVQSNVKGASQVNLNTGWLSKFEVRLPDYRAQSDIVATLDLCERIINNRNLELQKLDNLIKARFVEMFGDVNANDRKWPIKPLGELCNIVRGASPRPIEKFLGGTVPWIKIGDATENESVYLNSTKEHIIENGVKKSRLVKSGSLIFANCGVSLGFARIITFDGCIHDGWLAMEDVDQKLDKVFLLHTLNQVTEHFRKVAPAGTQPNLNTAIMKSYKQILPPLELQRTFIEFAKQVDKSKVAIQKSLAETQLLFDKLMQDYFG